MPLLITMTLELDAADYAAITQACQRREQFPGQLPDAEGNIDGRALAEICRGWEEMLNHAARKGDSDAKDD